MKTLRESIFDEDSNLEKIEKDADTMVELGLKGEQR